MKTLKIKLENCYGIKSLNYIFNFEKTKTYAIYATNGTMKTSFTKTFRDLETGNDSADLVFSHRKTLREITIDGMELSKNNIFIVESYNRNYQSEKISTLLVNENLKNAYDAIWLKTKDMEDSLKKNLISISGTKDIVEEISEAFTNSREKFLEAIRVPYNEVNNGKTPIYSDVKYTTLFDEKIIKVLDEIQPTLDEYIKRYNELINKSKYFKRGNFNHNNAHIVNDILTKNNFFEASHSILLFDGKNQNEVKNKNELEKIIEQELQIIFKDSKLRTIFDKIDKILNSNQLLKEFRAYIIGHTVVISELGNLKKLKQKVFIDYFKQNLFEYNKLVNELADAESKLNLIYKQAEKETTKWAKVVEIFNQRFNVPFTLSIENKEDAILGKKIPSLTFIFNDQDNILITKDDLLRVLSTGEQKALYILNLLFEIEARIASNQETLMIIDDIADSFDYKNKYAIIEYLKEISEKENFYQIILTHNFDFFRTIESRYYPSIRKYCLIANRFPDKITLTEPDYIRNPFKWFMEHTTDESMLVALIPFVRNIVEYNSDTTDYLTLTSVLHIKDNTETITVAVIKEIIKRTFNIDIEVQNPTKELLALILETADNLKDLSNLRLEHKIVLSIAIRLKSELFMIKIINDNSFVQSIQGIQTNILANRFIKDNPTKETQINIIKRVNLITPENIHLNSFMFEPIIDMSDFELKQLYKDVNAVLI